MKGCRGLALIYLAMILTVIFHGLVISPFVQMFLAYLETLIT